MTRNASSYATYRYTVGFIRSNLLLEFPNYFTDYPKTLKNKFTNLIASK